MRNSQQFLYRYGFVLLFIGAWLTDANAQVRGVSYTVAPSANYTWYDSESGLGDGVMVGAHIGFGFGQNIELRGTYSQSLNLENDIDAFGGDINIDPADFQFRGVDITRYGGEVKANLGQGAFFPHLLVGAGVQETEVDGGASNENVYGSYGLGITLSANDRFAFGIEGKNTFYNFSGISNLITETEIDNGDVDLADFEASNLNNWSAGANLTFYLGGRDPDQLSDVDLAYERAFSDGISGLGVIVEPSLSRINWDDALPYRDTWLGGANVGFDFGPLVGVRGFYYRAMQNDEITLDFDDMNVFGADFRFKLNQNVRSGLVPYLSVGGGYIDVKNNYAGRDGQQELDDEAFATGGGGLVLGLGRNLRLRGGVNALLSTGENTETEFTTDEIRTSLQYSVGVDFVLGKSAEVPDAVFEDTMEERLAEQRDDAQARRDSLKRKYEQRIEELNADLNEAYAKGDAEEAAEAMRERDDAEAIVREIEVAEARDRQVERERDAAIIRGENPDNVTIATVATPGNTSNSTGNNASTRFEDGMIRMSPSQFQQLIEETLESLDYGPNGFPPMNDPRFAQPQNNPQLNQPAAPNPEVQALDERMRNIEEMLIRLGERQSSDAEINRTLDERNREEAIKAETDFQARLLNELQKLQEDMDDMEDRLDRRARIDRDRRNSAIDINVDDDGLRRRDRRPYQGYYRDEIGVDRDPTFLADDTSKFSSKILYGGLSGFVGFNLGSNSNNTFNFGMRVHYPTTIGGLEFMPEAFFGLGDPSNFGLSANAVLPIGISRLKLFQPYIGTGFGFMQIGDEEDTRLRGAFNIILGTYLNVAGGRVYVDFTGRNLFNNNQIIGGYRFNF